jgi:hypothetical protein
VVPDPDWHRHCACDENDLDAAAAELGAVITLDPPFRIATITGYLADMDSPLRQRRFAGGMAVVYGATGQGPRLPSAYVVPASAIGALALVAGVIAMVTGSAAMLAALAASMGGL